MLETLFEYVCVPSALQVCSINIDIIYIDLTIDQSSYGATMNVNHQSTIGNGAAHPNSMWLNQSFVQVPLVLWNTTKDYEIYNNNWFSLLDYDP